MDTESIKNSKSFNFKIVTNFLDEWDLFKILEAIYDLFFQNPAFALHIAMVGQKLDFEKMMKQTLPMVLYRSHSLKEVVTIIHLRNCQSSVHPIYGLGNGHQQ